MNAHAYMRYRLTLVGYVAVWLLAAVAIIGFWHQLPLLLKGIALAVAVVVTPDIGMFERLFMSYERYSREPL
jgi:hypothetical protein